MRQSPGRPGGKRLMRTATMLTGAVGLTAGGLAAGGTPAVAGTNGQHIAPCAAKNSWVNIAGPNQSGHTKWLSNVYVTGGTCTQGPLVSRYWWKGWVTLSWRYASNSQYYASTSCYINPSQASNWSFCYS